MKTCTPCSFSAATHLAVVFVNTMSIITYEYVNTLRSDCDITIYRTTKRVFSKTDNSRKLMVWALIALPFLVRKLLLTKKLPSKMIMLHLSEAIGKCMEYVSFLWYPVLAALALCGNGSYLPYKNYP